VPDGNQDKRGYRSSNCCLLQLELLSRVMGFKRTESFKMQFFKGSQHPTT
jgi:hypothetical protein